MDWKSIMGRVLAAGMPANGEAASRAAGELAARVAPARQSLADGEDVVVDATFTNDSASTRYLLNWQTPFGALEAPLFEVRRDGLPVRQPGIQAKRPAPGPADYLAAGGRRAQPADRIVRPVRHDGQRRLQRSLARRRHPAVQPTRGGARRRRRARPRCGSTAAFDSKPAMVGRGCNESRYAYPYPDQPYRIYVCKAFWRAAPTGTDDLADGQKAAAELARSDPAGAVGNADSHEYLGENAPRLDLRRE